MIGMYTRLWNCAGGGDKIIGLRMDGYARFLYFPVKYCTTNTPLFIKNGYNNTMMLIR